MCKVITPIRFQTPHDLLATGGHAAPPASCGCDQPPAMTLKFSRHTICRWAMMRNDSHLIAGLEGSLDGETQESSAILHRRGPYGTRRQDRFRQNWWHARGGRAYLPRHPLGLTGGTLR